MIIVVFLVATEIFTFMRGVESPFSSLYKLGKDIYNREKTHLEIIRRMDSEVNDES